MVDEDGKLLGQYDKNKAMSIARDKELDLVQLSDGQDDIPICKILNYDKFRYQLQKKEKNQQRSLEVKEIQFGINITEHDKQTKVNHIKDLLVKGHKVKIVVKLKGREKTEAGLVLLKTIVVEDLSSHGKLDSKPTQQGTQIIAIVTRAKIQ